MKKEQVQISAEASGTRPDRERIDTPANGQNTMANGMKANEEMMTAFIRAGHSYSEGLTLLSQEVLDFSRHRISRDSATALSMAHCKDWEEASKIHREWVRATSEEYSAQMGKLLQLAAKTAIDSCRPIQEHAHRMWGEPNGRG